jgi:osmotically-inducible protein OsmY
MERTACLPMTLAAVVLAVSLAGCSHLPPAPPITASTPAPTAATPVAPGAQDVQISETVREHIAREAPEADIAVATAQGKVALTGTVENAEMARRAVKGALAVDGVHSVVNDLKVAPEAAGTDPALSASTL